MEREYVLGTHDDEIARLGLQHQVWRPRALDAWQRAGFGIGQTIIDLGCGPGFATLDLAGIVGPRGRVVAVERSRRFLDALHSSCAAQGVSHVAALELDLNEVDVPAGLNADGAWCRWVLSFVRRPRAVLAGLAAALKPGGALVLHEYFDYATWRMAPRCSELEAFVAAVMQSWRDDGGEPDIALDLPAWLDELGFAIQSLQPIVHVVPSSSYVWQWPRSFIEVGARRLVDLGRMPQEQAAALVATIAARESDGKGYMITPALMEIIAVRQ